MSIFTNPASRSTEQAGEYVTAVLDLLGSRDPMNVLRSTPDAVEDAVAGLTGRELSRAEAPGKWSMRHVARHLADSDLVWGYRLRLVLAQDRPVLTGFDQDRWATRLRYDQAPAGMAIEEFRVVRRSNLYLIAGASPADLQRVGLHAERGEESVAHMIRLYAGHDLLHLAQLARIRQTIRTEVPSDPPAFSIVRATVNDGESILRCMRAAFEPYRTEYTPAAYEDTVMNAETVRARIETMTVLVARSRGGEIIGTIGAKPRDAEGHIRGMAVFPSWQGAGAADQLLEEMENELRCEGCFRVTLDTTAPLARAIRFYERHGYVRSGAVADFFGMALYEYQKELRPRNADSVE
jgi:ribosomal protein S18 acetylase RimI-like enzyme